jgi:hypothetical protein
MAKLQEIHLKQILYKVHKDKLFQYEVIEIADQSTNLKSISSGYTRSCNENDLSTYRVTIPKTNKIARSINKQELSPNILLN